MRLRFVRLYTIDSTVLAIVQDLDVTFMEKTYKCLKMLSYFVG